MSAGLPSQAQEQSIAAAESAGQLEEAGLASLPPSEVGTEPASAAAGPAEPESEMLPASAGSPSVTAEGIASGGQGGGLEGVEEHDGGSGGREALPAAAASSGKLVVRSREQFMRVSLFAGSSSSVLPHQKEQHDLQHWAVQAGFPFAPFAYDIPQQRARSWPLAPMHTQVWKRFMLSRNLDATVRWQRPCNCLRFYCL